MNKVFYSLFFLLYLLPGQAQHNLLPSPQIFMRGKGYYHSPKKTIEDLEIKILFTDSIKEAKLNTNEAYKLKIQKDTISVTAKTEDGVYWAKQTLKQLIQKEQNGSLSIPCCEIIDWSAFPIRGFMHDVGRSFIPLNELKQQITLLSQFKINVFHWHLTENIAWRLESKKYPKLNAASNMTRFKGKYYTQKEAKELVAFCKKHHVLLIPEIDMPGHSKAFERTMGCTMQSTEGIKILKELIDEICNVFEVPYLHIGTDEVKFTNSNFVPEMIAYINAKGKQVISWTPGWNYKQGEIAMTQLWSYRGKAQKNIPAIDSRFHYINHFDNYGDIIALYNSKIGNTNTSNSGIAGAILAVWNDRKLKNTEQILLQNNFYSNMLALAERSWLGGGKEYFDKHGVMLQEKDTTFLDFERRILYHKTSTFKGQTFPYTKQTNIVWNITAPFPNHGKLDSHFPPEEKLANEYYYNGNKYPVFSASGASVYLRHTWGNLVPALYKCPQENHTAYAYTWVYSPIQQEVGLWTEFQNYSRSEKDLAPPQGKWDYKESKIWINDIEIAPPIWESTHQTKDYETILTNENMVAREPIPIMLKKGWNKIFMKLPVGKFSIPEVRLIKWMFTTLLVDLKTHEAVTNIKYCRNKEQ